MKTLKSDTPFSDFERLTCINPYFAADHILNEVRGYYWVELPAHLEEELASRAVTVFARNQRLHFGIESLNADFELQRASRKTRDQFF